tara:strand:- start:233 stop:523 length:291 start_codon:yes stop_codon:yes gene_type:complete
MNLTIGFLIFKERGKSLIEKIKEKSLKYALPDIYLKEITYRPIAIDLNNKKTILEYGSCFNPKLNNEIKDFWEKNDKSLSQSYLSIKICDKYAKFE